MIRRTGLLAVFAGLAVLHTWPLAGNLFGLSRLDNDDGGLNVFVISWIAHIVPRHPLALFDAPIFYPERYTLAYSEHMVVPSLMGAPFIWAGLSPIAVYNLLVLAGFTLSGWAMAVVVRRWTGSTLGGVTAGMLYAFNAHLLTRLVHLQALHMEFLPFALFAFDRVLRAHPGSRASGDVSRSAVLASDAIPAAALLACAVILQALCSNYTLVFLSVALLAAAAVRADEWLGPGRTHRLAALAAAGATAVAVLWPFLWPYYIVHRDQGLTRSIEEVALYSASWSDYLATGGRLHYAWWSHRWFEGRTALFPGVAAMGLAAAALLSAAGRRDPRVRMAAAIGLVGLALSFGPALPGYAWLQSHVPLFEGLRAAARWGLLPLTAVAILAGFGVSAWERRARGWTYRPAAALALLAVLTLEALRAPMTFAGVPRIPALYDLLRREPHAVLVELPLFSGIAVSENARYLVHSTRHFRPLVNGYSGFEPDAFRQRADRWRRFPAADVLQEMHQLGVTHVVVDTRELDALQVASAANTAALALIVEEDGRRLYRLRR
jgi:hypothetical protein